MTVGQLAQCFLSIDPQKSPARLAFYHYLKNMLRLEDEFRPEMIDSFYDRALSTPYWQANKVDLSEILRSDLAAISSRHDLGLNLDQIVHADELQLVQLEHVHDLVSLLARDVSKVEMNGEKMKIFSLKQDKTGRPQDVLSIRLQKTGRLIAEIRQNLALIVDGSLQLLRPHSRLTYGPELEFEPNTDQFLMTSLLRVARFQTSGRQGLTLKGSFIQGASFHRAETFERTLEGVPELFQAVKNVERFFVNPITDPYYHQMVESFGQALHEKNS